MLSIAAEIVGFDDKEEKLYKFNFDGIRRGAFTERRKVTMIVQLRSDLKFLVYTPSRGPP